MNQINIRTRLSSGSCTKGLQNQSRILSIMQTLCLLFFLTIYTIHVQAQVDHKVAVFDPVGTVDNALLEIVREEISSAVVNTTGYTVLERQLINKVLEENRFQESGLVSEVQISEIGKRMGADFVFVSTISPLGANYYISCKMIEVATARIDKQSTGTTTNGINDIPQTTQTIVKRLFIEDVRQSVSNRQQEQTDKPVQTTTSQKDTSTVANPASNNLIQRNVITDKENDTYKVELNKITSSSKKSNILFSVGGIGIATGIAATILLQKEYVEYEHAKRIRGKEYNLVYAAAGIVAGGVCIGLGVNLNKKESKRLDLVVTENGTGMRLTF